MTIVEKKGRDLRRKKMVVSWAYAASYQKPMSVPHRSSCKCRVLAWMWCWRTRRSSG